MSEADQGVALCNPNVSTAPMEYEDPVTYLSFELASQVFAADVRNVREILDLQPVTHLPNASHDLLGMIDVRGEGIAVLDLCSRLGLRGNDAVDGGRIIVFELGNAPSTPIGVLADRVLGVVEIGSTAIEAAPETMTSWDGSAVSGIARVGGALTMVLNLNRLFGTSVDNPFDFDQV